jgi:hypothetical protein
MQNLLKTQTAPADIFAQIREGFRYVAKTARHVRIREDRLAAYALSLQPRPPANTLDDTHHYASTDAESLAAYVLSLDAVNFGSGYKKNLVSEGWTLREGSIYYTVSTALKNCFDVCGPWNAATLRRLPLQNVQRIFGFPEGPYGHAVTSLFAASLHELGAFIEDEFDGRFMALLDDAQGQAARLVSRLAGLSGFQDVHAYRGRDIPVYKRAQIAAADLELAFGRSGRTLFGDIEKVTMFADDGVPHVLRRDGVLEYDSMLAARIDSGALIPAGSDEEIEIRCCAGETVERLAAIKGMRAMDLDHVLWHRSVEEPRYAEGLPHRTLTRYY